MANGDGPVDELRWGMSRIGLEGTATSSSTNMAAPSHPNVAASLLYRSGGLDDQGELTRSSSAPPGLLDAFEDGSGPNHSHQGVESLLENAFDNDGAEHDSGAGYYGNFLYGRTATGPAHRPSARAMPKPSYLVASKKGTDASELPMSLNQPKPSTPTPGAVGERSVRSTLQLPELRDLVNVSPWMKAGVDKGTEDFPHVSPPAHGGFRHPQPQSAQPQPSRVASVGPIPSFDMHKDDIETSKHGIWGPMPRAASPVGSVLAPTPMSSKTSQGRHISAPGSPLQPRSRTATPLQSPIMSHPSPHYSTSHRGTSQPHQQQQQQQQQHPLHHPQPHQQQQMYPPQMPPFGDVDMSNYGGFPANNYGYGSGAGGPGAVMPTGGMLPGQFGMGNVPGNMFFPGGGASVPDGIGPNNENLKNVSMQMHMAAFVSAQQIYAAQFAQAAMNAAANRTDSPGGMNSAFGPNAVMGRSSNPWDVNDREYTALGMADGRASPSNLGYNVDYGKKKMGDPGSPGVMNRRVQRDRRGGRHNEYVTHGDRKMNSIGVIGASDMSHVRSPLLEQFRATSASVSRTVGADAGGVLPMMPAMATREWQLSELQGHVVEFATDQHGSRFIQQRLEGASPDELHAVLTEALEDVQRLMMDVFGNYVVQKLLEHGGREAVDTIAAELKGRMLILSLHMYGCRVVQKALEVLEVDPRAELVRELDGSILKCIHDQNGNHVIQKCVELVEPNNVQFIVDAVLGQAVTLAEHSYGCRVVQRVLEHGSTEQKTPIMKEIMISVQQLINDQYGNYVIQHVVEHGTEDERKVIIDIARKDIFHLSQHKFASNVVERCLQHGTEEQRTELIEMFIVGDGPPNPSPLSSLVRDQFGNYVVQRVLDIAEPSQRERVVDILREQVSAIKKYSYGKHIIARLEPGWNRQTATIQRHGNNFFT